MRQNVSFFIAGAIIFFLFVFFSYLVHENFLTQIDFNTTVRLQDNVPRRVDPFFSWFSFFGNFEVLLVVLGFVLIAFRRIWGGLIAFFLFGMFHIIELFGKWMVDHPPPPQFLLRTEHQMDFPQFHVRSEFSYPSGHSGRTIFIATLLLFFIYQSKLSLPVKLVLSSGILGFTVIMLVSRVYLGEHWLSDVIGGSMLALAFALVSIAFLAKKSSHIEKKPHTIEK